MSLTESDVSIHHWPFSGRAALADGCILFNLPEMSGPAAAILRPARNQKSGAGGKQV